MFIRIIRLFMYLKILFFIFIFGSIVVCQMIVTIANLRDLRGVQLYVWEVNCWRLEWGQWNQWPIYPFKCSVAWPQFDRCIIDQMVGEYQSALVPPGLFYIFLNLSLPTLTCSKRKVHVAVNNTFFPSFYKSNLLNSVWAIKKTSF